MGMNMRRRVQTLYAQTDMIQAYHSSWVNCRVSREESSPLSILEAMACELPQIVSTVVAEQIPIMEDGKTGFVVDPDDIQGFVSGLKCLLNDPVLRDKMGKECRIRVLDYDLRRRTSEILKFTR